MLMDPSSALTDEQLILDFRNLKVVILPTLLDKSSCPRSMNPSPKGERHLLQHTSTHLLDLNMDYMSMTENNGLVSRRGYVELGVSVNVRQNVDHIIQSYSQDKRLVSAVLLHIVGNVNQPRQVSRSLLSGFL